MSKENKNIIIFKTKADRTENNIENMSDFFGDYVEEMFCNLKENNNFKKISKIPFSDLSIICEALGNAQIIMSENMVLVPDFKSLPYEIKTKLKSGIYKIGESKQVRGNLRAVILDENNQRIKDLTLKRGRINNNNINTLRNISTQLQLKQIYTQLNKLIALQTYQIETQRNMNFIVPFLNARELVLKAETKNNINERKELLIKAEENVMNVINAVYKDLESTTKVFACEIDKILGRTNIEEIMKYLVQDLQLITKYHGVRLQLLDYLGEYEYKNHVIELFKNTLDKFIKEPISKKGLSALELLQNYYPYNENNMNFWEVFAMNLNEISSIEVKQLIKNNPKYLYTISVEGC